MYFLLSDREVIVCADTEVVIIENHKVEDVGMRVFKQIGIPFVRNSTDGCVWRIILSSARENIPINGVR